ncbi:hypothetical protein L7F22_061581 [Adiantum nelumboides]|nr:hypothetical protein [Adiantum nelumboides]
MPAQHSDSLGATSNGDSTPSPYSAMADSHHGSTPFVHSQAWKEFVCGGVAAAMGESLMHPVDTVKTRMQSGGSFLSTVQESTRLSEVLKVVLKHDGYRGLYRGLPAGMAGSFATGATYFGLIEMARAWINERHPGLSGPLSHFCAGAVVWAESSYVDTEIMAMDLGFRKGIAARMVELDAAIPDNWQQILTGDTLGSVIYVPCEIIKQRMQIQGSPQNWQAKMAGTPNTQYYRSFLHAARCIVREEGYKGLFTGFGSTIGRDIPFAGLMIVFYEGLAEIIKSGKDPTNAKEFAITGFEDLVLGGVAGGSSAFLTTPLDIIKTRLQVQGSTKRYKGWGDAMATIWKEDGFMGFWKGSLPRVIWYLPACAVTFMSWQAMRNVFIKKTNDEDTGLLVERNSIDSMPAIVPHSSQAR